MGESYNALDVGGTKCPLCYRPHGLSGERVDGARIRCTGCYTTFIRHCGPAPIFDSFERVREPHEVERVKFAPGTEEQRNAGARLADDHLCQGGCGKRGVFGTCLDCTRAA